MAFGLPDHKGKRTFQHREKVPRKVPNGRPNLVHLLRLNLGGCRDLFGVSGISPCDLGDRRIRRRYDYVALYWWRSRLNTFSRGHENKG